MIIGDSSMTVNTVAGTSPAADDSGFGLKRSDIFSPGSVSAQRILAPGLKRRERLRDELAQRWPVRDTKHLWFVSPLCGGAADRIRSQIRRDAVKGKASPRLFWLFPLCDLACRCLSFRSLEFSRDQEEAFRCRKRSGVGISGPCSGGRIDSKRGWLSPSYPTRLMHFLTPSLKRGGGLI